MKFLEPICFAILLVSIVVAIWLSGHGAQEEQKSFEVKYQEALEKERNGTP